ncbi:Conserved hypothetical protein (DUF2461) [Geosmithia morbida]|uniref:Uncharacterized protein n=1 Tax=Geosmithia morbida TaxID=1094350 RepID=A0A9P4YR06_9HYPO|nr:Conserved hypothetical protein (DUF2461) [Geosmithia morbida]KAF4119444.1 Conserved hypothetical protein (DUF2461) [Geosmithia morbida]
MTASRKRSTPGDPVAAAAPSRRRSGRISTTSKVSRYFEASDPEEPAPKKTKRGGRSSRKVQEEIGTPEDEHREEQDGNEEDDEEEVDEDAPMKTIIIPLVKLRDTGGVEYTDDRIHDNTLLFLRDLKANNDREWLKCIIFPLSLSPSPPPPFLSLLVCDEMTNEGGEKKTAHDEEYRRALKDWESFVEVTTQTVIDVDETVPELPVKDVIFRIHRDIRFSKNPTPYKPHFSAAWSRTGRKGPYACYYIHCEPGGSTFIAGGLWCPEREHLVRLREHVDRHPRRWRRALSHPDFRRVFFPHLPVGDDEDDGRALVDGLVEKNKGHCLKKAPKGYDPVHRDIKLLRLKSFFVETPVDESVLCRDDAQSKIADIVRGLFPFVSVLK